MTNLFTKTICLERQSLLRTFVAISGVMVKGEFTVQGESKIFEFADLFYCLALDGNGVQSGVWCVRDQFLCFFLQ